MDLYNLNHFPQLQIKHLYAPNQQVCQSFARPPMKLRTTFLLKSLSMEFGTPPQCHASCLTHHHLISHEVNRNGTHIDALA